MVRLCERVMKAMALRALKRWIPVLGRVERACARVGVIVSDTRLRTVLDALRRHAHDAHAAQAHERAVSAYAAVSAELQLKKARVSESGTRWLVRSVQRPVTRWNQERMREILLDVLAHGDMNHQQDNSHYPNRRHNHNESSSRSLSCALQESGSSARHQCSNNFACESSIPSYAEHTNSRTTLMVSQHQATYCLPSSSHMHKDHISFYPHQHPSSHTHKEHIIHPHQHHEQDKLLAVFVHILHALQARVLAHQFHSLVHQCTRKAQRQQAVHRFPAPLRAAIGRSSYRLVFARFQTLRALQVRIQKFQRAQNARLKRSTFTLFADFTLGTLRCIRRFDTVLSTMLLRSSFHTLARASRSRIAASQRETASALSASLKNAKQKLGHTVRRLVHEEVEFQKLKVVRGWHQWVRELKARYGTAIDKLGTLWVLKRNAWLCTSWGILFSECERKRNNDRVTKFATRERMTCYSELLRGAAARLSAVFTGRSVAHKAYAFWRIKAAWIMWRDKRRDNACRHQIKQALAHAREMEEESYVLRESMSVQLEEAQNSMQALELERERHNAWRHDADQELKLLQDVVSVDKASLSQTLELAQADLRKSKTDVINYEKLVREQERRVSEQEQQLRLLQEIESHTRREKDELKIMEARARTELIEMQKILPQLRDELSVEMETRKRLQIKCEEESIIQNNRYQQRIKDLEEEVVREHWSKKTLKLQAEEADSLRQSLDFYQQRAQIQQEELIVLNDEMSVLKKHKRELTISSSKRKY